VPARVEPLAAEQRNQTAASARFRVSQFHDFENNSADISGGRQSAQSGCSFFMFKRQLPIKAAISPI